MAFAHLDRSVSFRLLPLVVALGQFLSAPAAAQTGRSDADAVRILSAQAGLFGSPASDSTQFRETSSLPLKDGQYFGWMMMLRTSKTRVLVREELTLPAEPSTWGDPEPGLKRKTSADGKTATTEIWLEPKNGAIFHSWTITQGDPRGTWVLRVWVDAQPVRSFRLEAR